MRPVARRLPSGIAFLALAAALPLALGAQSTDTLLSALKLPSRAGFAPLVPPPPGRPVLLRPDRVFDATNEETHTGWAVGGRRQHRRGRPGVCRARAERR